MNDLRVHRLADVGLLVELDDLEAVLALDRGVRSAREEGDAGFADVVDVVPAAVTLTLTVAAGSDLGRLEGAVREVAARADGAATAGDDEADPIRIEVTYDGEDLADVARIADRSVADVVAAHAGTTWRAAFGGFAPGFLYLVPAGDPQGVAPLPSMPRRDEPRTKVPVGSVGLAGDFSAVYPRASPGGWQLVGRTDAPMWDVDRDPPALLRPGALVRFVPKETP